MKKIIIFILLLITSVVIFAQTVDKGELFKVKRDSVEFINYEGPHQKYETADEIRGIGIYLGNTEISNNLRSYNGRYSIIHLVSLNGQGLLNADILTIEKDAVVDHINNVRRILSGYLEQAYSYSKDDSDTIAEFATYYNAVYRGNFQYFQSSYNKIVTDNLDPKKAGISTRYLEWPGNSQIIIPLTASGEMKIDTDVISNKTVIEDLRTQDDKGIQPRKNVVELKEREIEEQQDKIEEQKKNLEEETKGLETEKEKLEDESGNLADNEIRERETEIEEKGIVIEEKRAEIKELEEKQQDRQEEVQKERKLIAEDEKLLIEEEKGNTDIGKAESIETVPFLIIDGNNPDLMGRLALINTKTGEIDKQSSINTVRGRHYYLSGKQMLIVSGIDRAPQAVRLMFLNAETLEVIIQGNYDVFGDTDLLIHSNSIFAVVRENEKWYVGRFNNQLILQLRSNQEVLAYSSLQLNNGILYVQLTNGKIVPLNPVTLKIME